MELYPSVTAGGNFLRPVQSGLTNLFCDIGAPWFQTTEMETFVPSADHAALRLHDAFTASETQVVHLCPLDLADHEIFGAPENARELKFGPYEIRKISRGELDQMVRAARLVRHNRNWVFDSRRFEDFFWLVVRETRPIITPLRSRLYPWLDRLTDDPHERHVTAHLSPLPSIMERGLFVIWMLPWEDWLRWHDDWRPFKVPWCYTVVDDPLDSPSPPPDSSTLTWQPNFYRTDAGEEVELEVPVELPLDVEKVGRLQDHLEAAWNLANLAREPAVLSDNVIHFVNRAFREGGIDEFLAHIVAIEAAVGLPREHTTATRRRIGRLMQDSQAVADMERLYSSRNEFLHGRDVDDLRVADLIEMRKMARAIIEKLLSRAHHYPGLARLDLLQAMDDD
ncbi:MAG: hypothetical protein WBQ75_16860 [Acetobacteraceae bacterium]